MHDLKTALVFGGKTGGIGTAVADHFRDLGWQVVVTSSKEVNTRESVDAIEKFSDFLRCVFDKDPDVVVNATGTITPQEISSKFYFVANDFDINLYDSVEITKCFPESRLIHIGSTSSFKSKKGWSSYAASKAALVSFVASAALEGYKTVCVSPGRTDTKMRHELYPLEDPNTLLKPSDVANVVGIAAHGGFTWGSHVVVRKEEEGVGVYFTDTSLKKIKL